MVFMIRRSLSPDALESLLQPESELERALITIPVFRRGLLWGEPRFGHPEGSVALHVHEVLENISLIPGLSPNDRAQLRLVALAHDAFKYAEDRSRPRDWSKHHGLLARHFMAQFTDRAVLDLLETHDDAYYHWLSKHRNPMPKPFSPLLEKVGYCIQLYYLFFKCDTQTGDKTQAPLRWFESQVEEITPVIIKNYWPWERV